MSMRRKTITVTEQQNSWIKSQIESGQYGNDSEYLRELVRKDQEYKKSVDLLRSALIEGEQSGISDLTMDDIWSKVKDKHALDV